MKRIGRHEFSYEQLTAIELLSSPDKGGHTFQEIAEMCNVSERQLRRWRNQENFQREIQRRVLMSVNEQLADIMNATVKKAVSGSGKHAELVLKSLGLLKEQNIIVPKNPEPEIEDRSNEAIERDIEELRRQLAELDDYENKDDDVNQ